MRTQQLNAPPSRSRAVLPQSSPPRIVRFVARDDDNADETLGAGDALEIGFDRAARPPAQLCTGRAAAAASDGCADSGDRDFVDALFEFSEPLGAAYRGSWRNAFTFEIIISDASNASLRLGAACVRRNPPRRQAHARSRRAAAPRQGRRARTP